MRKYGAESTPHPATHCQFCGLLAGSASQSVSQNHCLAAPPVDQKVFCEERGRDHAHAVVHEAGAPELAHAGVDERIAGFAARPGAKAGSVVAPGEALELPPQRPLRHVGMGVKEGRGEVAPAELGEIFLRRLSNAWIRGRGAFRRGGGPSGRDLAEAQMGGEARGAVDRRHGRARARRKEALRRQSAPAPRGRRLRPGSRRARVRPTSRARPGSAAALRSGRARAHARATALRVSRRERAGSASAPRARWRRQKAENVPAGAPPALASSHGSRMSRPLKLNPSTPRSRKRRLHSGVEGHRGALVAPGPQHPGGAGGGGEGEDRPVAPRRKHVEPRAALGQSGAASLARDRARRHFAAPPSGRPFRGRLVVDIDIERRAVRDGGDRRLVVEAEVVAQPDDVDAHSDPF